MSRDPNSDLPRPVDAAFRAPDARATWHEPSYSGAQSFFRRRFSRELAGVDLAFVGVPLDVAVSNRPGARFGPQAVRRISGMWEPADPAWPQGWNPFDRLAAIDYGDLVWDYGHPTTIMGEIERQVAPIVASGATMVAVGGDHAMTYALLKAHVARDGALGLLQFDAHQDTWADDGARLDHGTFVSRAVAEGLIDPERSIQVGIRTVAPETCGIHIIDADQVVGMGVRGVTSAIEQRLGRGPSYLTFDIDCLDPAFAPGTGTPVPGGLQSREALMILRALTVPHFVGYDVVEVSPPYDHADLTANAAAGLLQQIACLVAERRGSAA